MLQAGANSKRELHRLFRAPNTGQEDLSIYSKCSSSLLAREALPHVVICSWHEASRKFEQYSMPMHSNGSSRAR